MFSKKRKTTLFYIDFITTIEILKGDGHEGRSIEKEKTDVECIISRNSIGPWLMTIKYLDEEDEIYIIHGPI